MKAAAGKIQNRRARDLSRRGLSGVNGVAHSLLGGVHIDDRAAAQPPRQTMADAEDAHHALALVGGDETAYLGAADVQRRHRPAPVGAHVRDLRRSALVEAHQNAVAAAQVNAFESGVEDRRPPLQFLKLFPGGGRRPFGHQHVDAVVETQRPASPADPARGRQARRQFRGGGHRRKKRRQRRRRALADDQRERRVALDAAAGEHAPVAVHHSQRAAVLPERHRPPFDDADMEDVGPAPLDSRRRNPGIGLEPFPHLRRVDAQHGVAARHAETFAQVLERRFAPADDEHLVDRETGGDAHGDRLAFEPRRAMRRRAGLPDGDADDERRNRGKQAESARRARAGDAPAPRGPRARLALPAVGRGPGTARAGEEPSHQTRHRASSTIQATRSG